MLRFAILLALAGATGGCTKYSMVDDVEFELHFFLPWAGRSNEIHSPYVIGTTVQIYATSTDSHENMSGWKFDSSNPSVFAIAQSTSTVSIKANALSAGTTVLSLRDAKGNLLTSQSIEVKIPDAALVLAHGPLILGQPDGAAAVTSPRIVAGGTATFLIRWLANGQELSGNGVLSTDTMTDLVATAETTEFLVERDWLAITAPKTAGTRKLTLFADGHAVTTLPINVVDASAINHITLAGGDESGAKDGTWMVVLAEAFDAANDSILGVDYTFDIDGATQAGIGDLYRYQFESKKPKMLTAHSSSLTASAMIHAGTGYVDSTNNVGCSMGRLGSANRSGPNGAMWIGLLSSMVIVSRRRLAAIRNQRARQPLD